MKKIGILYILLATVACTNKKNAPDVSSIKIDIQTTRFEKDFFALDTTHLDLCLQKLYEKNKGFSQDFFFNILGTPPDSVAKDAKLFLQSYKSIYNASIATFADFSSTENAIKEGLKYVHHYFPAYPLPTKIITFIGPLNSYAGILTPNNGLAIGLQLYMGKDFSVYQTDEVQNMYPSYISRRFEPVYIPVNSMKNIIDDLFSNFQDKHQNGGQLIEKMIDEGKRLYVLDAFLPYTADTLKIGYTANQLKTCFKSEENIWAYFVQADLLFQNDPSMINTYVTDGPNTSELGTNSPGNIGLFVGWQIVKTWMEKHDKTTLQQLIQTPSKQIFQEAKYKPH